MQPTDPTVTDVLAVEPGGAAVVSLGRKPNRSWTVRVSRALKPRRVIFAWPQDGGVVTTCLQEGREASPDAAERQMAERVLAGAGSVQRLVRVAGVRTPRALATVINKENEATLRALLDSVRSPTGVIPFVGAGMSKQFGCPLWDEFLRGAALSQRERAEVEQELAKKNYEAAAQVFMTPESEERFQTLVTTTFDIQVPDDKRRSGTLALLPLLTSGPVVTTNFDRALEQIYDAAGPPYAKYDVIAGRQPDRILRAMQQNQRALIKLHGDVGDRSTRTFTAWEYEKSYGPGAW